MQIYLVIFLEGHYFLDIQYALFGRTTRKLNISLILLFLCLYWEISWFLVSYYGKVFLGRSFRFNSCIILFHPFFQWILNKIYNSNFTTLEVNANDSTEVKIIKNEDRKGGKKKYVLTSQLRFLEKIALIFEKFTAE